MENSIGKAVVKGRKDLERYTSNEIGKYYSSRSEEIRKTEPEQVELIEILQALSQATNSMLEKRKSNADTPEKIKDLITTERKVIDENLAIISEKYPTEHKRIISHMGLSMRSN